MGTARPPSSPRTCSRILCRESGANPRVVGLFALLHDLRRKDEGSDPHHGPRAAAFIREIADEHLLLDREELAQLCDACIGHSEGELSRNPTIATCWDADRLDLGRVGTRPQARFLSLDAARHPQLMAWAWRQSIAWVNGWRRSRRGPSFTKPRPPQGFGGS